MSSSFAIKNCSPKKCSEAFFVFLNAPRTHLFKMLQCLDVFGPTVKFLLKMQQVFYTLLSRIPWGIQNASARAFNGFFIKLIQMIKS